MQKIFVFNQKKVDKSMKEINDLFIEGYTVKHVTLIPESNQQYALIVYILEK